MSVCVDPPCQGVTLSFPWRITRICRQWRDDTAANAISPPLRTSWGLSCLLGWRADAGQEAAWDFAGRCRHGRDCVHGLPDQLFSGDAPLRWSDPCDALCGQDREPPLNLRSQMEWTKTPRVFVFKSRLRCFLEPAALLSKA